MNTSPTPKGLIQPAISTQYFDLERKKPTAELADIVDYYWIIRWDRTGKPAFTQSNLPHVAQHLVINPYSLSGIVGIHTKKFSYTLQAKGQLLGVRFKVGAFRCFYSGKLAALNNTYTPFETVFPMSQNRLEARVRQGQMDTAIAEVEAVLLPMASPLSADAILSAGAVAAIENQTHIHRVEDLASLLQHSERKLQRIFVHYVGVSPKWVISRYRIFEVLAALDKQGEEGGGSESLALLAQSLGYHDQAHFSHVFKRMVGLTPLQYLKSLKV